MSERNTWWSTEVKEEKLIILTRVCCVLWWERVIRRRQKSTKKHKTFSVWEFARKRNNCYYSHMFTTLVWVKHALASEIIKASFLVCYAAVLITQPIHIQTAWSQARKHIKLSESPRKVDMGFGKKERTRKATLNMCVGININFSKTLRSQVVYASVARFEKGGEEKVKKIFWLI